MTEQPSTIAGSNLWKAALLAIALLIGSAIWLWNGPGSAVVAAPDPFDLTRRADGSWPEIPAKAAAFSIALDASKRESSLKHSTSSWTGSASSARFAGRSFAVFAMSDDALTDLISLRLVAALQRDPATRRISYRPSGKAVEPGNEAPDIVLTVYVRELTENTVVGSGGTRAECIVTAGSQLGSSNHHIISAKDAPHSVKFGSRTTATLAIERRGFATPNARLANIADDLANAVAKDLTDSFTKMRSNKGEFPELPEAFAVEYRPVDASQFALTDALGQQTPSTQLASWRDRLIHNTTWWRAHSSVPFADTKKDILARMAKAGWRAANHQPQNELRFSKGLLDVQIIYQKPEVGVAPKAPTGELLVSYRERADEQTRQRAAESLFTDDSSPAALMVCSPMWNPSQTKRGRDLINQQELTQPGDLMQRSHLREQADDLEGAIEDLRRAYWFAHAGFEDQDAPKKAVDKAKELGATIDDADPDWLQANGFRSVQAGDAIEADVTPQTPIRLVFPRESSTVTVVVGLMRNPKGQWRAAIRTIQGGSVGTVSNMAHGTTSEMLAEGTLQVRLLDEPDDAVVRVRVELQE